MTDTFRINIPDLDDAYVSISASTDKHRSETYGYDVIGVVVRFDRDDVYTINGIDYKISILTGEIRIHDNGEPSIGYFSLTGMHRANWNGDVTQAASRKVHSSVTDLIQLLIASGRIELLRKQGDRKRLKANIVREKRANIVRAKLDISKAEKDLADKLAELEQLEAELG